MGMKGKIGLALLSAVFLGLTACGSGTKSESAAGAHTEAYASDHIYEQEAAVEEAVSEEEAAESGEVVSANRKLIKRVNMEIETEEFDILVSSVESKTEALGGYIEDMNLYNGSSLYGQTDRRVYLTIRIPKEKLDEFVNEVAEVSNVVSRNENTEDVTMQYVDLESHKKALQIEQERLLDLLEQAESIEDIIALESRLSEVRYELESMESELRTYDNLVDYATVTLNINEVERLTPLEEVSDGKRMADGFVRSLQNLMSGLKNFCIGLVINLPYLIFYGLVILGIVWLIRLLVRKGEKKKQQQKKQTKESGKEEK